MMKVGEVVAAKREIVLNEGRQIVTVTVENRGDRPIQVGSHYHFFEVNKLLCFDREAAYGMRLDIPSGTSVRFEPGEESTVTLTAMGGKRRVYGLNDLTVGELPAQRKTALETAKAKGFLTGGEVNEL
ncbi:urease subunit beta [Sporomusa acidovorans]|uniref:Urease subunit beta n=1 Tax=Sporomusa acidovorans (strain ATCC 49682 / DSM 3132 / Mol) TaxID=1123286 RepID=A0ABZ3J925_SPOA4|nr:urease subunit beta [Sporomusa acidovorans]OZC16233.1 urease subunit alpha [Sporomusa acidovorans DSM 3132]SDE32146.1 urease subunit beta [Sporomusa acidovorans]